MITKQYIHETSLSNYMDRLVFVYEIIISVVKKMDVISNEGIGVGVFYKRKPNKI